MTSSKTESDHRIFFTLLLDLFRREHLENIHFHISISNIVRVSGDFREVTSQCFRLIFFSVTVFSHMKVYMLWDNSKRAIT